MRKILSLLLALALVCGMTAPAAAAEFKVNTDAEVVSAGGTVTVTITLDETVSEEADIVNVQGELYYDAEMLTYVSHEMGVDYQEYRSKNRAELERFQFSNTSMDSTAFAVEQGVMATVVFSVKEDMTEERLSAAFDLQLKLVNGDGVTAEYSDCVSVVICKEEVVPMFRMYDPNSGEHFYTGSEEERDILSGYGWEYEGVAWYAPTEGAPVYRVYNPNSGDHHYTMAWEEVKMLEGYGWKYEGIGWYSASEEGVPVYRVWNINADRGSHHYTCSEEERDWLVSLGWIYEGIGWYGVSVG